MMPSQPPSTNSMNGPAVPTMLAPRLAMLATLRLSDAGPQSTQATQAGARSRRGHRSDGAPDSLAAACSYQQLRALLKFGGACGFLAPCHVAETNRDRLLRAKSWGWTERLWGGVPVSGASRRADTALLEALQGSSYYDEDEMKRVGSREEEYPGPRTYAEGIVWGAIHPHFPQKRFPSQRRSDGRLKPLGIFESISRMPTVLHSDR
eukprot:350767-Chlamydomonas_euryale.AAC.5